MSGDKDGLLYWPKFFLDHSSSSFASWLGLLNRGSLRAQSPLSGAGSHFGILSPSDSNHPGTWLYYFLTPICFHYSSAYLRRCISWLTAQSRVNITVGSIQWYCIPFWTNPSCSTQQNSGCIAIYLPSHKPSY